MSPGAGMVVDHIDGNGLNNAKANLRICTFAQNIRNSKIRVGCSSKYKGVCWDKKASNWRARIMINGRLTSLGSFDSEESAGMAYDTAAISNYGEYASTNGLVTK